jgi:Anti-sigma factor NepR
MTQRRSARQVEPQAGEPVTARPQAKTPGLQPQVQDHIGRQLRALYDDVLGQPVPDRFKELMERLDRKAEDGS